MNQISSLLQHGKAKDVKAAESEGIRDQVKIMIGGAPITEAFCKESVRTLIRPTPPPPPK